MCTSSMMKILKAALERQVRTVLHQVAHLVDLGVRGAVDFEDVESQCSPVSLQLEQALHGSGVGPCSH